MRFLFKIYSGYDGFSPAQIPARLTSPNHLLVWWTRYLDSLNLGDEVWVYFHGPHRFISGVYIKGFVSAIDHKKLQVRLRISEFSTTEPLTKPAESARIARIVAARGLQVFLFPEDWGDVECDCEFTASSCKGRYCGFCSTWKHLQRIRESDCGRPPRMAVSIAQFAPGIWVIPSRCYVYQKGAQIHKSVRRGSDLFYRFKLGVANLAYPMALLMYEALKARKTLEFDSVFPIPLSPDKRKTGEIDRTGLLAVELARLLGSRVVRALELTRPISKHQLRTGLGLSPKAFETEYSKALAIAADISKCERILLVDDVCTEGSTLRCAGQALRLHNDKCEILAATAGQMILKSVVQNEDQIAAS